MIDEDVKDECDTRRQQLKNDPSFMGFFNEIRDTINSHISLVNFMNSRDVSIITEWIPLSQKQDAFNNELTKDFKEIENKILSHAHAIISENPVYNRFLKNIVGIDTQSAMILLSQFAPWKVYYVLSMHQYAGLQHKKHQEANEAKCNPLLRGYILSKLADDLIIQNSEYALEYYSFRMRAIQSDLHEIVNKTMQVEWPTTEIIEEYKAAINRYTKEGLNTDEIIKPRTTASRHDIVARQYMLRLFVRDYYKAFRTIYNIPIIPTYDEIEGENKIHNVKLTSFEMFMDADAPEGEKFKTMRNMTLYQLKRHFIPSLKEMLIKGGYKNLKLVG
jgi:hypothetical protein